MSNSNKVIHLGAGCFWSSEKKYYYEKGVTKTEVGWSTYVPEGHQKSGKIEVVRVEYNPNETSIDNLVDTFWSTHNPTHERNKDPYYVERSMLFATDEDQFDKLNALLEGKKQENPKILTEVARMNDYIRAPEKDQKYYLKD